MGTLTVYPDAHPEDTSVDGLALRYGVSELWADIIANAGNLSVDSGTDCPVEAIADTSTNRWERLFRGFVLFDTSALPDACTVTGAILSLYGEDKYDTLSVAPTINIYVATPVADTSIADEDYGNVGSTPLCDTAKTYASWSTSGYNNFTLNAAGLANISKTNISKFAVRNTNYDVDGVAPSWTSGLKFQISWWTADKGTTYRPKLVITYSGEPTVTTQACTNTIAEKSTGHGNLTSIGAATVTQHGHCWGTSSNPTTALTTKTTNGAKPNLGQFQSAITGLTPGTLYYVRAYATNSVGTSYGANVEIAGDVTTLGKRYWWVEGTEFHYFDEYGTERKLEGLAVASGLPWWYWM